MRVWTCSRTSRQVTITPYSGHGERDAECLIPLRRRPGSIQPASAMSGGNWRWCSAGRWPMSCVNPAVLMKSELRRWQPISMERGPNS